MNDAGYESHMVGKWHLGGHEVGALPSQRGFKSFLGYLNGVDTYYSHKVSEGGCGDRSAGGTYVPHSHRVHRLCCWLSPVS